MRITPDQAEQIRRIVAEQAGAGATVHLFDSRLDDTLRGGDLDRLVEAPAAVPEKVLPAYPAVNGEKPATFVENLDRAERRGLVQDAQAWLDMRCLCNQMVHAYVEPGSTCFGTAGRTCLRPAVGGCSHHLLKLP